MISFWKNIFNFKDRTDNKTFWDSFFPYNTLFIIVALIGLLCDEGTTSLTASTITLIEIVCFVVAALLFIALLALATRRLHDTNNSGWCLLFLIVQVVGPIILLSIFAKKPVLSSESKYLDRPYV